jgi:CRP-like cAMP-binding protein
MPYLHRRLHCYSQCLFNDVAQTVACNGLHSVEQRCARWLLMTHDRVGEREFELKQSSLSLMLGTRRNAVSEAASDLAKRGHIQYSRAKIEVLDREGLEKAACSCYRITRDAYDKLLGELTS